MYKFNINSFSLKIFLSFILLGLFLLAILFFQIIPDMKEKEKEHMETHIENVIYLTTQQIKLAEKAIKNSGKRKIDGLKSIMEREANRIFTNMINTTNFTLNSNENTFSSKKISCNTSILDQNKNIISQTKYENFEKISNKLITNDFLRHDVNNDYMCTSGLRRLFYTKKLETVNKYLVISCDIKAFPSLNGGLEKNIKINIQTSFSLLDSFHKGKTYVMWLNKKQNDNENAILHKKDNPNKNLKYCLSHLSNLRSPTLGLLSGKQIEQAVDKDPINHMLDTKSDLYNYIYPAHTWVRQISENETVRFLYLTTIYEKDYNKHIGSPLLNILPSALISFIIAILLGFLLFKRLFKTINILTDTASQVIKGNLNKRNHIKGSDDISTLAKAFDKMLDYLENNIANLDKKVANKTKELSSSLNEKEILLKEIHHRVKNNLAITINLIKIEKSKISNEETKNSLSNIQERVFVMELLHRKPYESKDLSSISFDKYVSELCEDLNTSYSKNKDIKITTHVEDIDISIDYALPLGLVITELVTNSFKYAFKNDGLIEVIFKKRKDYYSLIIRDNGRGLHNNIDINNTKSLGLQIVSNIIKGQLFGDFKYSFDKGSSFEITFKIENKI